MPKLTTAAIARFRPTRKRREIRDSAVRGLYLIVQPTGAKSFALRFNRPDGTPAKLTLGPLDLTSIEMPDEPVLGQPLTLSAVHQLATTVHRQRALGRDVIADYQAVRQQQRVQTEQGAATAFSTLVRQFMTEHAQPKTRRWRETARLLGLDYPKAGGEPTSIKDGLYERWAIKPIAEIANADIYAIIDETRRLGTPGLERRKSAGLADAQGRSVLAALSALFGWCVKHRYITASPCTGIYRPDAPDTRERVLTNPEIVAFWNACDDAGEPVGQMLKLLLLTGARFNEVRGMARAELSEDGTIWNIPASRTKNRKPHVVPLPKLARDIITSVRLIAGASYLFTGNGKVPVSFNTHRKRALDAAMQIRDTWRLHDLRRTCATGMAEIGIAPHIIEAVLNHVSGARAGVAGVYNRAQHKDAKAAALERWAAHVEAIVSGKAADVITLAAGKKRGRK